MASKVCNEVSARVNPMTHVKMLVCSMSSPGINDGGKAPNRRHRRNRRGASARVPGRAGEISVAPSRIILHAPACPRHRSAQRANISRNSA